MFVFSLRLHVLLGVTGVVRLKEKPASSVRDLVGVPSSDLLQVQDGLSGLQPGDEKD